MMLRLDEESALAQLSQLAQLAQLSSQLSSQLAVTGEQLVALAAALRPLTGLEDVVRWGFSCAPPREVVDVVVQDEYCHDVIMTGPGGLYLCFDTT